MKKQIKKMVVKVMALVISVSMSWGCVSLPVLADSEEDHQESHVLNYINLPDEEQPESVSVRGRERLFRNRAVVVPEKWGYEDFKDYMPELRDQGQFGSCWAQSAMALAEINLSKKGLLDKPNFSEVQLAYFSYNWETDPLGGTAGDANTGLFAKRKYLGFGGNVTLAENILASWTGASLDAGELQYPDLNSNAPAELDSKYAYDSDAAHLMNYRNVNLDPTSDEDMSKAKQLIMEWGALGISFYAQSSVSRAAANGLYNTDTNAFYDPKAHGNSYKDTYYANTNHAVTIVGWDDNFSASNFAQDPGHDGAWLIRNSWTTGSYEKNQSYDGYFWMSYYNKDLDDCVAFDFDLNDNYNNNYQYDGGMSSGSRVRRDSIKGANVFRANASEGGEILKAVSFCTERTNESYTVEVYVSNNPIDETNMESGKLVMCKRGTTTFAGYYNVELDKPVNLASGQYFAVIVKMDKPDETASLSYEKTYSAAGWYSTTANITKGQSYLYNFGDDKWEDLMTVKATSVFTSIDDKMGNLRIKAFTDNGEGIEPEVTAPDQPADPEPTTPEQPADPEPTTPEQPADPEPTTPDQPVDPEPTTPDQPADPEPTTPDQPSTPEPAPAPVTPAQPSVQVDAPVVTTVVDTTPRMELNDNKLVVRTKRTSGAIKVDLKNDSVAGVSISNPKVASVSVLNDSIMVVAGKKKGKAVVTVTSASGIVRTFTLETQTGKVTTKRVVGVPKKVVFTGNGQTASYQAIAIPNKISTGELFSVTSNKPKVATATINPETGEVSITSVSKGKATIKVMAGKKKLSIKVTVK